MLFSKKPLCTIQNLDFVLEMVKIGHWGEFSEFSQNWIGIALG